MFIIIMMIGVAFGLLTAYFIIEKDYSFPELLYAFVLLVISYLICTVIHESGHLVMGLRSGYGFVSFRIGSLTWIKENGKLVRKKFSIAGTGGQCVMMPPDSENPEDVPFALYLSGGGLFNLILAAVFIPVGIIIPSFYASMPFLMLGVASLILGAMNLIPIR